MKRLLSALCIGTLLSGCASLSAISASSEDSAAAKQEVQTVQNGVPRESYPKVIVTPEGKHATMMPPCGNLTVIVNPDGSHSTALVNGNTAIILTP